MPISLTPDDARLFWLASDKDIPLPERPVFICRAPTRKVMIEYLALCERAQAANDITELEPILYDAIMLGVTGWRNMGDTPFSREALPEVFVKDELDELAFGWPRAFQMTADEKKASGSPPVSAAEQSAPTVESAEATGQAA